MYRATEHALGFDDAKSLTNAGEWGIIKVGRNELLKYIERHIVETDNQHIREWYYANVSDIPNQIDKYKPIYEQAKQAFELRNKYKHEARLAMSDKRTVEMLEKKRPMLMFDELLHDKMIRKKND